jgi:hypothetical protein
MGACKNVGMIQQKKTKTTDKTQLFEKVFILNKIK